MAKIGTCWKDESWKDSAWATGTWAGSAPVPPDPPVYLLYSKTLTLKEAVSYVKKIIYRVKSVLK